MQEQLSVIRAIHGANLAGQRFALLKIAPGNFFISRDGRYSEAGISKRQTVGVSPDERHSLCEWQMPVRDTQSLSVIRAIHGAHLAFADHRSPEVYQTNITKMSR